MTRRQSMIGQMAVRFLCAIAFLFVGSVHQVPQALSSGPDTAELAQYVLPDGTLPVLCVSEKASDNVPHDKMHAQGCEACRITASVMLPAPADLSGEPLQLADAVVFLPRTAALQRPLFPPKSRPRAPPVLIAA